MLDFSQGGGGSGSLPPVALDDLAKAKADAAAAKLATDALAARDDANDQLDAEQGQAISGNAARLVALEEFRATIEQTEEGFETRLGLMNTSLNGLRYDVDDLKGRPGLPVPAAGDDGKALLAHADGTYSLGAPAAAVDTALTNRVTAIEGVIAKGVKVIAAAAGEAGLRAALTAGLAFLDTPGTFVVVDVPEQPDIALTDSIILDAVEAPRCFLRAPAWENQPAPTSVVSAVASGVATGVTGIATYDITLQLAANHTLAVGSQVVLVARSTTGAPAGAWQELAGYYAVQAVPAANRVTVRVPSSRSLTGLTTLVLNGGANSVTFSLQRVRVNLVAPAGKPALYVNSSRFLGFANFGLISTGTGANDFPFLAEGTNSLVSTMGAMACRGGNCAANVRSGACVRFGGVAAAITGATDTPIALTGAAFHGLNVALGGYVDANKATSLSACGNGQSGVFVSSGEAELPALGTYAGNYQNGLNTGRRGRSFFRPTALYLPVAGNTGTNAGNVQVFANLLSLIDALGIDASITSSPAANTLGNDASYILR